ncbi:hypothetical protein [Candidatus Chromulinivorax destructor]|uniref:Uncharacterized protein n=1 Tax=Candidatus Chromulinivorax destructor TaxID=2066483 RepID=A0A345ZCI4_9BACT|nr:hypothetical protein [Candidatus Chromulinivorax destructor]AXK61001.1 hypothetical protein C0J27_04690 [Candidatus Chromulinivorax destructor]
MKLPSKNIILAGFTLLLSTAIQSCDNHIPLAQLAQQAHDSHAANDYAQYAKTMHQIRQHNKAKKPFHKITDAQTEQLIESAIALGLSHHDNKPYDKTECFYGATRSLKSFGKQPRFQRYYPVSPDLLFQVYDICQHQEIDKLILGKSQK